MLEIEGVIEDVIFRNEENGYTVALLVTDQGELTIVGSTPFINIDETVKLRGEMVYHNTYGEQFSFDSMEAVIPTSLKGIRNYLSSGLIPNIGPETAKNIVDEFGHDSLDVIQYSPDKLLRVKGIGKKKLETIVEAFEDQREMRDTMVFLQQYNISVNYGVRIYKKYGPDTIKVLKENPYKLTEDIRGIGFKRADEIARNMGIEEDNPFRIMAGIKYSLNQSTADGHCYMPREELIEEARRILNVEGPIIEEALRDLYMKDDIRPIEDEDGEILLYLRYLYEAEEAVSGNLITLASLGPDSRKMDIDREIEAIEEQEDLEFASRQKEAIRKSLESGLLVITGGPGTGKTTTINAIIKLYEDLDLKVTLAAPTGRAAKRMAEATGREAKTIHRLLEYSFMEEAYMGFGKNEESQIETDVLIVDEASMIDILLMNSLLKAVKPDTNLILVGDIDQLPSVGPGNVLRDIIDSEVVELVRLDEIFRQSEESMIIVNAHRINKGDYPILNEKGKDFYFINRTREEEILENIIDLVDFRLPKYYKIDSLEDIQVLSPMKKGELGVNSLNDQLQKRLNPADKNKKEKAFGDSVFRVGDKVMQMKNNYDLEWEIDFGGLRPEKGQGVFNGDMGIIKDMDLEDKTMEILFDDEKLVEYDFKQLDELSLAYATTVHKSQGSEFPVIIMPMSWGPPMLLTRNLLYTGITRAKKLVVLVGESRYMAQMISNNRISNRYSRLNNKLVYHKSVLKR